MTARFPHLLSPLRIGGIVVPNRILSSGHDTVLARDGAVTDDLIAYHEARAAGGVGLIVLQVSGVHESARYTNHVLMATEDACVPGYARLAEAVHRHGTKIFGQLFHPGREILESKDGTAPVAWAPSAVPSERFHVMPRAMTESEIREVVAGYGQAARRLREAGLDGVEIVASHGYLPAQFLSPHVNRRTDGWGGESEGRLRFLREALRGAREQAGPGFAVGLRVSGDEHSHDGLDTALVLDTVERLDAEGLLDYVSVCAGSSSSLSGAEHIAPPMFRPAGYTAPLAGKVRAVVGVPVMVAGRINQPQEAEQIIADGRADACAMTRALICDPELPAKTAEGRAEEIRACVGCNQACIGHFQLGHPISCIQHPETGRERRFAALPLITRRKKVLVVGGGPAGLKAAAVAAGRGHEVELHEADRRVGGQVLLAELLPGRAEFGGVVTNLEGEARRAGVRVVTGSRIDVPALAAAAPDVVVLATGARPRRPSLELMDDPVVLDAWSVIRGAEVPRGRIVVADWRGDWIGLGVALRLAGQGRKVTLCVTGFAAGEHLQQYVRAAMLAQAMRARVEIVPNVRLYGADADTVYLQHTLTEEPVLLEGVAAVVLAQGHTPVTDFDVDALVLEGVAERVVAVGDCVAPRTVEEAVLEGLTAASAL
ncbi:FAD-dependent oxidoreductase [Streptomyces solicathayae]|uniref:FAD-dependent oxidoreductase n=1 Tax=Streptomyces solicathayae TaxID=3081768 RepID=A0ABZ0M410_9ACTN|nr:FAD-dependent oxidoreductase [Streptomyces sp. HUAS YS2]WOX26385.1 FAD-dependent oxidoreductase [Streptomyces sp. HUAS YS2]